MPDALWALVEPLLPVRKRHRLGCHNPRVDDRRAMNTILFVLRTSTAWHSVPRGPDLCHGSSAYRRFREWTKAKVFARFWKLALEKYDELKGLDWKYLTMDGSVTKAPHGGEETGPSAVDRRKDGTKRNLMTGAAGIPVGMAIGPAGGPDHPYVEAVFNSMPLKWPAGIRPIMLMDAGYDYAHVRASLRKRNVDECIARQPHRDHTRTDNLPPLLPRSIRKRRHVVEITHSWMNGYRRVRFRWERRADCYMAKLHLTMGLVILQRLTGGRGDLPRLNRRRDHEEFTEWEDVRRKRRKAPFPPWRLPAA